MATELGTWTESEDGRSVNLEFQGGHVVGASTTFVATWVTPTTTKGESPSFESTFGFNNMNLVGDTITLTESLRYRERGGRWSKWFGFKRKLAGGSWWSGGSASFFIGTGVRNYQFEWRLKGVIKAPTYLEGSVALNIN